ncbi:GBF-interacting protein 1-like isoform X1 [Senna tora]|uniref:GBF-interacting protein 1-like isoform X1 n=1 Tax=Senna tora TaxID=362788 RepID=A0A834T2F2_9FABA|nr:GBF-interacting protein 1-like isoform X1 [Senna tora]
MVSASKMEAGTYVLSAKVRKTIQSIKEIVGDHSDADIYVALKETDMDPNETTQKLLNQDTFHEVKRRRERKKEPQSVGHKGSAYPQRQSENVGQGMKFHPPSDHNIRRRSYTQNTLPGISREFRVVRDNRVNHIVNKEVNSPSLQCTSSNNEQLNLNTSEKGLSAGSGNQRSFGVNNSSQASNGPHFSHARHSDTVSNGSDRISAADEKQSVILNGARRVQQNKTNNVHQNSATLASNSSAVGVYSSSTDPVHVPSPDSRSPGVVGAIRREVGAVGVRRQASDNSVKQSSDSGSSYANSLTRKDGTSANSFQSYGATSKTLQFSQTNVTETSFNGMPVGRPFLNNHYNSRSHQQPEGHQRVSQPNKEWKPKSSQKSSSNPGVIGTPKKTAEISKDIESSTEMLQDKLSQVSICENQNVIIAPHIRVPETDRCQLTFGTIGTELDSSRYQSKFQSIGTTEKSNEESPARLALESSDDVSGSKLVDFVDDQVGNTGLESPASGAASEQQLADQKESLSPQNLENYADIGLVRDNGPSYVPSETQQQQDSHDMPGFSVCDQAYDPPAGYDIPYFRPTMDEAVRAQSLPSPQEGLSSHAANSIPASTIAMVQQQTPVAQMYPQVHVSHFANLMPFRQFLSPVYVPPLAMPGYSSNPPYPHPSNGNSYVLMPGGGSHLNANSLKYGLQQFKPVPSGSPTAFGNFTNPAGYAMNAPGVVGGATTLEDSSRIKYKDNLYVPNPQAETSEIWIQNPRELPGMQSAPYFNMAGQTPHAAAYIPSHTGHASFNAAVAQSSHMQYPGMYHAAPQPAAMASPHHLGPAMANNVGVAAAPGAQVGAYQQPQLGHVNWTTNF